ncbi:hypothetical protein WICMUC_000166 [Wickerhamomyces mucosus]|uniref:DUF3074 domain-containing protein n=1 Tax=Wickerhamomyces mucosus TaxID=1378264 RepID=A0A9P8Q067_9ASCO|nr:hypothetical protein WICMUC_000166 [Wickerhamomyces mucosus]
MGFQFDTKPHSIDSLPKDTLSFINDANELIESVVDKWTKLKTYSYKLNNGLKEQVTTYGYTDPNTKEYWLSRISIHDNNRYNFQDFLKYIVGYDSINGLDIYKHTEYELNYIHVLSKWNKIPLDSYPEYSSLSNSNLNNNWGSISVEYELGSPLKTRQFNEFIFIVEPGIYDSNVAFIIQLVSNKPVSPDKVAGVYVSIERIKLLDNNEIEWRMATSSDSGGNVPKWLQNSMISKSVAGDVPSFLNWLNQIE